MYRDCVQTYKNAVRRHEREAAEFAKEIARIVSNSASDTSFKKEKKKEGEDEDKEKKKRRRFRPLASVEEAFTRRCRW